MRRKKEKLTLENLGDMAFAEILVVGNLEEMKKNGHSRDIDLTLQEAKWLTHGRQLMIDTGRMKKYL